MNYLLEGVIAEFQVNLIAGASATGKTRFLFQLRATMELGGKMFRRETIPARWGYIAGDRTGESLHETLNRMGLKMPVYSCIDRGKIGASIQELWPLVIEVLGFRPEFLVIDGFTSFCPEGEINNYQKVAKWLGSLQNFCDTEKVTILGACHTTKSKKGEEITDPRQRILGSTAWASYTEGVIVLDKLHQGGPKDKEREIYFCGRNSGMEIVKAQFTKQGWLEEREEGEEKEKEAALDLILGDILVPGTEHRSKQLEDFATAGGVSRATFHRWLSEKKEKGELLGGKGQVIVPWDEAPTVEEDGTVQ